ncbi:hypothetical protein M0R45_000293 [Rubus argutus]|uniref:Uncharacterized protein n=1 Tax=Rubus argutus TaxID=59490 RepID=A0AAW1VNQ8_RUBAR
MSPCSIQSRCKAQSSRQRQTRAVPKSPIHNSTHKATINSNPQQPTTRSYQSTTITPSSPRALAVTADHGVSSA